MLCSQHSTASSGCSSHCSSSGSSLGRPSSEDSLGSSSSPERPAGECELSNGQSHQERNGDVRDQGPVLANGLQRNLLAQYKGHTEGSRMQAKAAAGTRVTFGRGQPLQPLPEGSPSPFQVSIWTSRMAPHVFERAAQI